MAVGFVVVQAVRQPDHGVDRQVLAQHRLDLFAAQVRVAVAVEQAFLGGDHGAFAVHVDRATFQHEALGLVALAALHFQYLGGQFLVTVPGRVEAALETAPGIEAPVHTAHFAVVVDDEGWAGIAHPGIVIADFHHADVRQVELATGVFVLASGNPHGHRLEAGDGLGQRHMRSLRRFATQAPVVRTLRPDHPDLGLRRPFSGHMEAVGTGGGVEGFHG
ncbi:hypothetical protein D3C76_549930 [compost metagenome]